MLSDRDNETLTKVGPGTAMGAVMRHYWQPLLISSELPIPDGPPLRVRLLGEDLVAFRTTDGSVGLVGANCPHRGAPLAFGRNEEGGLRCIYHGWKFNVTGQCVAMPNVPEESDYKAKVRTTAYPCQERNGVIWTYMGDSPEPPELPRMTWNMLPPEHTIVTKQYLECNYHQAMEGDFDGSHVSFLHSPLTPVIHQEGHEDEKTWDDDDPVESDRDYMVRDPHPVIMVLNTEYGLISAQRRDAERDQYYWRFNNFVMPFYAGVPEETGRPPQINIWQPIDDYNTTVWRVTFIPERPYTEAERIEAFTHENVHIRPDGYLPADPERAGSQWLPKQNRSNDYGLNRDLQKASSFAGIPGIWAQDRACTEGMGAIMDRKKEYLGPSDVAIIQLRRTLIAAARNLQERGIAPPVVEDAPQRVTLPNRVLSRSLTWAEVSQEGIGKILEPVTF
jgi:phthalate 4,5-dioxygenase oxygenase subunit